MIVEVTPQFKKALKKLKQKNYPMDPIIEAVEVIQSNNRLYLNKLKDHKLKGNWQGYRELHPFRLSSERSKLDNIILIYKITKTHELVLVLVALGTHDKLF